MIHPETGEVLETEEEMEAAVNELQQRLSSGIRVLRGLQDQLAVMREPPPLPRPRYRSDKQSLMARCPRCGEVLKEEGLHEEPL